jgi:hypothetical protein
MEVGKTLDIEHGTILKLQNNQKLSESLGVALWLFSLGCRLIVG